MRKNQHFTPEQIQKIKNGIGSRVGQGAGRKLSEATKEKISLAKKSKKKAMQISLSASPRFVVELKSDV